MADVLTPEQRSRCMSNIRGTNTKPELRLRDYFKVAGITGYKMYTDLPGKPDFVFEKEKLAVFVDGCFWHKCPKCFKMPRTNTSFWKKKLEANVARDKRVDRALRKTGWKVVHVREHQVRCDVSMAANRVVRKL